MKKHVVPHNFSLEEKRFVLNGNVVSVTGELDNSLSDWQSSRRGKGLVRARCHVTQYHCHVTQ